MDNPVLINSLVWLGISTLGIIFCGIMLELAADGVSCCFGVLGLGGSILFFSSALSNWHFTVDGPAQ